MRSVNSFFSGMLLALALPISLSAQSEKEPRLIDNMQVDVKDVYVDPKTDTATVSLFLISYNREPREFKLNTYATQLVDAKGEAHLFSKLILGRVQVSLTDQQNYMHFLFQEEVPAPFTIKVAHWDKSNGTPKAVNLVFEDSEELGKFITFLVILNESQDTN